MKIKASISLLVSVLLSGGACLASSEGPVAAGILEKTKGQNFEQDLLLARSHLQMERRSEAQKLLSVLLASRKDERVMKLLAHAGSMFFHQETADLYHEGLRLLLEMKLPESRERLEQALSREPGQVLVIQRLIQLDLLQARWDSAATRIREALPLAPQSGELRFFAIKVLAMLEEAGRETAAVRGLPPVRRPFPAEEVPFVFALEYLKKAGKTEELRTALREMLPSHPEWVYARAWAFQNAGLGAPAKTALKNEIDRGLKNRDRFEKELEKTMRRTRHYWIGYISYETLVNQVR